jgi:hypothetical protein
MRRALAAPALAVALAIAVAGCETTQQRSAQLERQAKRAQVAQRGLSITRRNPDVKVVDAVVVHDSERTAAVLTLLDVSSHPVRDVPVGITVRGRSGAVLYQNNAPGLQTSLVQVPLLEPRVPAVWVDDQVQTSAPAGGVSALVGAAPQAPAPAPALSLTGVHRVEDPTEGSGAAGSVANRSNTTQQNLVVYGVVRRAGRIVAAGRAVIPEALANASTPFQLFLVGDPKGGRLEVSALPTTLK